MYSTVIISLCTNPLFKGREGSMHMYVCIICHIKYSKYATASQTLLLILDFWNLIYAISQKIMQLCNCRKHAVNNREVKMPHKGKKGKGEKSLQMNSKELLKCAFIFF